MNLFSLHNFILREHILRRHLPIISLAVTPKNKLRKKKLTKKMQLLTDCMFLSCHVRILRRKPKSVWVVDGRDDIFWQNLLNQKSRDWCWKKNFRLSRESFFSLYEQLPPYIATDPKTPNYRCLSSEKKLALTLYYLTDTGSLLMTANVFGVHQCTASKIIILVCNAINKHLGPAYLHLSQDKDEMIRKVSEFELKFGMIQAFGCIDGTHTFL